MVQPEEILSLWGLEHADVRIAAQRENVVYRVTTADKTYALRLHRRGYHDDVELVSELQWMAALGEGGLKVPEPLASRHGKFLEVVDGLQVDVLTWLPGEPIGATGKPLQIENRLGAFTALGVEMARLHDITDAWQKPAGFRRKAWDKEGLIGDHPLWGRFWDHPGLTDEERGLFNDLRSRAAEELSVGVELDFGLIHADLVRENVMINQGDISFIDFDDSGHGFRLFEIATALLKNMAEHDYPDLAAALVSGYRSRRSIDTRLLPLFLVLRALTYVGWIKTRMQEPGASARSARFIAQAKVLAKDYLNA